MAKRFTDTTKWKRPWFRALSPHAKVLWQYLCDECDHAGIFLADFELTTFQVGFKVDEEKLRSLLGDKIVKIDKDRYFIPSFFEFQYGDAKDGFKAKQSAIKSLKAWNLLDESDSLIDLTNSYLSVTELSPDCHIIGKIKIKGNTGDARGEDPAPSDDDYEDVYQAYPKKVGKSDGLAKLKKLCPTFESLNRFQLAMHAYVADCKANDVFLKQFDTLVNSKWQDWLDPDAGSAVAAGPISIADILAEQKGRGA
jgi:hypothetical protein